jgi:hypothetical protein
MDENDLPDLSGAVWLRRHALQDGLNDKAISRLVGANEWHRIRRGAFSSGQLWDSLRPEDRLRLRNRAVLLTAHPNAVLSHTSAAVEWGADTWGIDLTEVHLTRTDGKAGRREDGVVHHRGRLDESEVSLVNGVRVTGSARCAVETCSVVGSEPSLVVVNSLLHRGAFTKEDFETQVSAARHWPGSLTKELVRRLADLRIESVAESRAFHLFWREQIPRPEPQYEVFDEVGLLVGRVDFAWPELGAFAEIDGRLKYLLMRRPGESLEQFLLREKRREEAICAITGWVCIRITWADLARPRILAQRIRRILAARGRASA